MNSLLQFWRAPRCTEAWERSSNNWTWIQKTIKQGGKN